MEDDFKTPEADLDEFHPKATRTLFVGNLEKEISIPTLKEIFKPFGEIIVSSHRICLSMVVILRFALNIPPRERLDYAYKCVSSCTVENAKVQGVSSLM